MTLAFSSSFLHSFPISSVLDSIQQFSPPPYPRKQSRIFWMGHPKDSSSSSPFKKNLLSFWSFKCEATTKCQFNGQMRRDRSWFTPLHITSFLLPSCFLSHIHLIRRSLSYKYSFLLFKLIRPEKRKFEPLVSRYTIERENETSASFSCKCSWIHLNFIFLFLLPFVTRFFLSSYLGFLNFFHPQTFRSAARKRLHLKMSKIKKVREKGKKMKSSSEERVTIIISCHRNSQGTRLGESWDLLTYKEVKRRSASENMRER